LFFSVSVIPTRHLRRAVQPSPGLGGWLIYRLSLRVCKLRAAVSLARLRRDQGRLAEARDVLAPVYGWFTEGFGTPDLKEAKALIDELSA